MGHGLGRDADRLGDNSSGESAGARYTLSELVVLELQGYKQKKWM